MKQSFNDFLYVVYKPLQLGFFSIALLIFAQLYFVDNIVNPGYLNPYTQYEFQFNPELDQEFQTPEMRFETLGTMYNNQYFALGFFRGNVTPKYFMIQIDFNTDFEIIKVLTYPVTSDELNFSDSFTRISSNGTHLWLLSSLDKQNIKQISLDLSFTQDIRLSEEYLVKDNLLFIGHLDLTIHNQSLWILEEYQNTKNEPVIVLNQYSIENFVLQSSVPIEKELNFECKSFSCRIFVVNNSYWILSYKENIIREYSWDQKQISQLTIQRIAGYKNPIIHQDFIISKIEASSFDSGINVSPFREQTRPLPIVEFAIWFGLSGIGIIGIAIAWRLYRKYRKDFFS